MTWSPSQQKLAVKAASLAGWTDAQRYLAMRHVGCPCAAAGAPPGRASRPAQPSVKHPGNTQDHYELYMAIAESSAAARGTAAKFPRPAASNGAESWTELTQRRTARTIAAIERIAAEAMQRLPDVFRPGFLAGFIQRMTMNDRPELCGGGMVPLSLPDCDEAQLYRIHEGLKAWAGREFLARDQRPGTFTIPASVYAQLRARAGGAALRAASPITSPERERAGSFPCATASVLAGRDEDAPNT
jgi:hypothetical protein